MGRNAPNFIIIYMYTLENSLGVKSVFSFYLLMQRTKWGKRVVITIKEFAIKIIFFLLKKFKSLFKIFIN